MTPNPKPKGPWHPLGWKYTVRRVKALTPLFIATRKMSAMEYARTYTKLSHHELEVGRINRKGDVLASWRVGGDFCKGSAASNW